MVLITLNNEQERVLSTIFRLSTGNPTVPVTIGAIHHSFTDMDVSVLVRHLSVLLDLGLIENARPGRERLGNTYRITAAGIAYCSHSGKNEL
ncbi:RIO2 family protein [Methanoregula formicica]|uniref:Transcriptional regulator n=1 Tax=Methanoregula formicica (strain DSM 22288 / NBRC 105244 / SMSP) TaxID=593750 RepID=L0HEQ8_METFS|nr:transcriptional regulator [Methanoregula formicica]AGB01798.1 hypothetical protein Metfor_0738 [Methanoregula formicica SMSP]